MANHKVEYTKEEQEAIAIARKKIGKQVKIFRTKVYNISVRELSMRSNVSDRQIIYIEDGEVSVGLDKLVLVAAALRLEIKLTIQ